MAKIDLGEKGSSYFADLQTALAYSLDWWDQHSVRDKSAYVIEAQINLNDKHVHHDEDTIAYNSNTPHPESTDVEWTAYFDGLGVPSSYRDELRDAINVWR